MAQADLELEDFGTAMESDDELSDGWDDDIEVLSCSLILYSLSPSLSSAPGRHSDLCLVGFVSQRALETTVEVDDDDDGRYDHKKSMAVTADANQPAP